MTKRVLYVFGGEIASGAEIVIERLIENSKFQSHLFIAPGDFSNLLLRQNKAYKINIINGLKKLNRSSSSAFIFYLKAFYNYFSISYIVFRYIKKNKIDVVHCNTIGPASYILPLIFISPLFCPKVKWVWSDHDIKYYYPLDLFFSKVCSRFYDITFVVSEAVKKKYFKNQKIVVLYNGLDCDVFKPDEVLRENFRTANNFNSNNIVIGIAGVIAPRKGQLQLIQVFNILNKSFKNLHLILAGRFGEDDPQYTRDVKLLLNSPDITYLQHITVNMAGFFNGCDIVVSNSDINGSEPLGTTIYEAMACEKIVAASNTGGSPEIVDDGIDGYLFKAENLESVVEKLTGILNNYNNLKDVKSAAREKAVKKFNINNMALNYRDYLDTY